METLLQGSSVCVPKAEVQSHLDPQESCVRVLCVSCGKMARCLQYENKAICFTSETPLCHMHRVLVQLNACGCCRLFGSLPKNNAP